MKDISYEILDLFKTYGSTREGMDQALDQDERPQVLHALSPIRENLLEWLDLTRCWSLARDTVYLPDCWQGAAPM